MKSTSQREYTTRQLLRNARHISDLLPFKTPDRLPVAVLEVQAHTNSDIRLRRAKTGVVVAVEECCCC
jgi:hypothetical protein